MTRYTWRRVIDYRFPWMWLVANMPPLGWGIAGFIGGGLLAWLLLGW